MLHYSYNIATGIFTGRQILGEPEMISMNTEDGEAWFTGECNPRCQRVVLVTNDFGAQQPTLVDYQPPAPSSTAGCTWRWDEAALAWMPEPTSLAIAASARIERDQRLQDCDWVVTRAVERAEPVPAAWAAYRQALRDVSAQAGFPQSIDWPVPPA